MKNIVTSIFSNPQYGKSNHRSLEIFYLKQLFDELNVPLSIVGNKNRTNKDVEFFKDVENIDDNVQNVFIQLSPANFFGGVVSDFQIAIISKLANLHDRNFYVLVNDPRIKHVNPAKIINDRWQIFTDECIAKWDIIIEKSKYLYGGNDINKFFGSNNLDFIKFDLFTYIFKNNLQIQDFNENNKTYDLVYFGDKRGSYRESKIKKYFSSNSSKNLLIGYKTKSVKSSYIDKVNHENLLEELNNCKTSLIIGDEEHENNIVTYRLYETLASNCIAAIDYKYDFSKSIIQNDFLKSILYVTSNYDIQQLNKNYSKEIIDAQKNELHRIFNNIKIDLNFL